MENLDTNKDLSIMLIQDVEDVDKYRFRKITNLLKEQVESVLNGFDGAFEDREKRLLVLDMGVHKYTEEWMTKKLDSIVPEWRKRYEIEYRVRINGRTTMPDIYTINIHMSEIPMKPSIFKSGYSEGVDGSVFKISPNTIGEEDVYWRPGPGEVDIRGFSAGSIEAIEANIDTIDASQITLEPVDISEPQWLNSNTQIPLSNHEFENRVRRARINNERISQIREEISHLGVSHPRAISTDENRHWNYQDYEVSVHTDAESNRAQLSAPQIALSTESERRNFEAISEGMGGIRNMTTRFIRRNMEEDSPPDD